MTPNWTPKMTPISTPKKDFRLHSMFYNMPSMLAHYNIVSRKIILHDATTRRTHFDIIGFLLFIFLSQSHHLSNKVQKTKKN